MITPERIDALTEQVQDHQFADPDAQAGLLAVLSRISESLLALVPQLAVLTELEEAIADLEAYLATYPETHPEAS